MRKERETERDGGELEKKYQSLIKKLIGMRKIIYVYLELAYSQNLFKSCRWRGRRRRSRGKKN